jgi:adiponectin receptor
MTPWTSWNRAPRISQTIQMAPTRPRKQYQSNENFILRRERNNAREATLTWNELFTWQQDNRFITNGYRPASYPYRKSVASIWHIHNQSVNIWTHLLGAVAASFSTFTFYGYVRLRSNTATSEDVFMFSCFFVGAAGCLSMSAAYHAISNHSAEVAMFGNQLDCALPLAYIQTITS